MAAAKHLNRMSEADVFPRKRGRGCWRWVLLAALVLLLGAVIATPHALRTPTGRAAFNVAEYRLRTWWDGLLGERRSEELAAGGISGVVRDGDGNPLPDALVLLATTQGESYHARSDELGTYRIEGVPSGRYVPVAGKWGYEDTVYRQGKGERTTITVRPAELTSGLDFALARHEPWQPSLDVPPIVGPPQTGAALFPAEVYASRVPITFTCEGLVITTTLVYEPLGVEIVEPLPVLVASYPSEPMNWDRVSVAIASEGYVVLASGPSPQRGLDIPGMARDLLQTVAYLRSGTLTPHADTQREGWLSGSFSSVIQYQALREDPGGVDALVVVGGISDALVGVQALYSEQLEIPPKYETAIAALGRADRYPEVYLGYSPAFEAEHMPPTFVVHTTADEVIPPNQAVRFAEALDSAGVTHELFLYEDTTHYLDQVNVTPDTAELYRRLTAFLDTYVRQAGP